ncbi:MAG: GNAT family N-acetyltransferase [Planctomycetota bacterium]|jgi:GNAT superfamily N-acetyltransferase
MKPIRLESTDPFDWTEILDASRSEGYNMVNRLLADFRAGTNRFDAPGELLLAQLSGNGIVAVAGLNRERDESLPRAGRIRRLYVVPDFRGRGLGRSLVDEITAAAPSHFGTLTVNVGKLDAHGFYENLGFSPVEHPRITHRKELAQS